MAEAPVTVITEDLLIPATADELWPLVSTGAALARWYAFGGAEIDARPGGAMVLRWDEHGSFPATVERIEPGRLLAFRWQPEGDPLVEIRLEPGAGATRVTITESGRLDNPELDAGAWRNSLGLLRDLATGPDQAA